MTTKIHTEILKQLKQMTMQTNP